MNTATKNRKSKGTKLEREHWSDLAEGLSRLCRTHRAEKIRDLFRAAARGELIPNKHNVELAETLVWGDSANLIDEYNN